MLYRVVQMHSSSKPGFLDATSVGRRHIGLMRARSNIRFPGRTSQLPQNSSAFVKLDRFVHGLQKRLAQPRDARQITIGQRFTTGGTVKDGLYRLP